MTTPPKSTPSHYMLPWSCPSCSNDPCRCEPDRPSDCPTLEDLELATVEAIREVMRENGDLPARPSEPAETLEQERDRLADKYAAQTGLVDPAKFYAFSAGFDAAIEYIRRGGKVG